MAIPTHKHLPAEAAIRISCAVFFFCSSFSFFHPRCTICVVVVSLNCDGMCATRPAWSTRMCAHTRYCCCCFYHWWMGKTSRWFGWRRVPLHCHWQCCACMGISNFASIIGVQHNNIHDLIQHFLCFLNCGIYKQANKCFFTCRRISRNDHFSHLLHAPARWNRTWLSRFLEPSFSFN